jgi:hypothetical protein
LFAFGSQLCQPVVGSTGRRVLERDQGIPVKTFGIYLLYPPKVDLRAEGLGRHLAAFLKEACRRTDVRFVIACPSWMRSSLDELFESAGIPPTAFEIIGPKDRPILLRIYDAYQTYANYRRRQRRSRLSQYLRYLLRRIGLIATRTERLLVTTRSPVALISLVLLLLPLIVVVYSLTLIKSYILSLFAGSRLQRLWHRGRDKVLMAVRHLTVRPQNNPVAARFYRFMEDEEADLLCDHINSRRDISAWYTPTAFWPHFNDIKAPRLTCVPDVVLSDFPIAFSSVNDVRFLGAFRALEKTIEGGDHFVTYSREIKYRTLIQRYQIAPDSVTVIPHGVNRLDDLIKVSGFADPIQATDSFSMNLFRVSLHKAINTANAERFDSGDVKFIFYASQFRPNKNIFALIRAYEFLLRERYLGHKLVLTGNPNNIREIAEFIADRHLQNDVLCLHGLSERELAACYRVADLAVNPSLSEGGCPFTLTEALSVGTPVVMARIAVTEEVVTDPELQELMLFDAYKWRDIAARIEWALKNREFLLDRQLPLYEKLAERSWGTVVDEYVTILHRISTPIARAADCAGE